MHTHTNTQIIVLKTSITFVCFPPNMFSMFIFFLNSLANSGKYITAKKREPRKVFLMTFRRCQVSAAWPAPAVQPSYSSAWTHSTSTGMTGSSYCTGFAAEHPNSFWRYQRCYSQQLMLASTGPVHSRTRDEVAASRLSSTLSLIPKSEGSHRHRTFPYERQSAGNALMSASVTKQNPAWHWFNFCSSPKPKACSGAISSNITT